MDPQGRFLARKGGGKENGYWYDIGNEKARDKTSQALRENAPTIRAEIEVEINHQRAKMRRKDEEETMEPTTPHPPPAQEASSPYSPPPPHYYPPPQWARMPCRPPDSSDFDADVSILFEYLYRDTPFHVSCGAKFGSDFLIYDGPREERHAFAGLRILSSTAGAGVAKDGGAGDTLPPLPLPTAYSLSGYVRCLNTAGKLALLATVRPEQRRQHHPLSNRTGRPGTGENIDGSHTSQACEDTSATRYHAKLAKK
jgi:hypothetical protein